MSCQPRDTGPNMTFHSVLGGRRTPCGGGTGGGGCNSYIPNCGTIFNNQAVRARLDPIRVRRHS